MKRVAVLLLLAFWCSCPYVFAGEHHKSYTRMPAEWADRYNSRKGDDNASAIAVDSLGNVFITGSSGRRDSTNRDYATIKYNNSGGTRQWVRRYNGLGNGDDGARAIAVDSSGNVYVTGYSQCSGTGYDYATIKYDSHGTRQWVKRYNGPVNGDDRASTMALDSSGNVYVTGSSQGSGGYYNYATIKYDGSGTRQWVKRHKNPYPLEAMGSNLHSSQRSPQSREELFEGVTP